MTVDDLATVLDAIWDARARWYHIGLELRLRASTLDIINRNIHNDEDCFRDMLAQWLTQIGSPPTWSALAAALRSRAVGFGYLAEQVESEYVSDVTDSGPATEVQEGESIG